MKLNFLHPLKATPYVAGIVAYWINLYNNLAPPVMKDVLRAAATKGVLSDLREPLAATQQPMLMMMRCSPWNAEPPRK